MKNFLSLLFISLFIFSSCSDEEIITDNDKLTNGGFASFKDDIVKTVDYQNGAGIINFTVIDPNNNGVKYRIYKIDANIQGVALGSIDADFVYNSFPANVSISLQQIATLYGLSSSDVTFGDKITFYAEVTTNEGKVYQGEAPTSNALPDKNLTTQDLLDPTFGYKQAMKFSVVVACQSYNISDMLGTYTWIKDEFNFPLDNDTFECIQGNSPNQIIFKNWRNDRDNSMNVPSVDYDLVVDIDASTQSVTIEKQLAWNSAIYNFPYGLASVEGNGLVFSCIGEINMNLKHTVSAGSFGTFNLVFKKL